jgi:hypothetical protein
VDWGGCVVSFNTTVGGGGVVAMLGAMLTWHFFQQHMET